MFQLVGQKRQSVGEFCLNGFNKGGYVFKLNHKVIEKAFKLRAHPENDYSENAQHHKKAQKHQHG